MRVRFAPSPTGNLHIGSVRTALFNYLFARHHNGQFVLRIEDTDQERSSKEYELDILQGLEWLGLKSDEPIVYQHAKNDVHKKYVNKLIEQGIAYKDPEGSPAVYFRIPKTGQTILKDLVKGDIVFQNEEFKDQVILKSDGSVTYNFAVVIDDAEMGITHVIRGEDHISNTPKQIFFYQALGFPLPEFAHLPMILGPDRTKLSKRHGATSINEYRAQGFLPESINNYLALLGWTPADGKEIMTMPELIERFDLDRVSKSNSIFDVKKLLWVNKHKLSLLPDSELLKYIPENDSQKAEQVLVSIKDSIEVLTDLKKHSAVYFKRSIEIPAEEKASLSSEQTRTVFAVFSQKISGISEAEWSNYALVFDKINVVLNDIQKETGFKKGLILHPIRIALTGESSGPSLKYLVGILGKKLVLERIAACA